MQASVLDRLGQDHRNIELVMRMIEAEVEKFELDDVEVNLSAIADALTYIAAYPDAVHHPVEERLFNRLESFASTQEMENIETLRAQHKELCESTRQLQQDVDNILNDIVVPITKLQRHLKQYLNLQRQHMELENESVFKFAEDKLDATDWSHLQSELEREQDPLTDRRTGQFDRLLSSIVEELELEGEK